MKYPTVIDPEQVGEYDAAAYSGGGYFFDEVLEYRVWCYANKVLETYNTGNSDSSYNNDDVDAINHSYHAFTTYQQAVEFTNNTEDAEKPVVLIRQLEWVDQPSRGVYIHNKGERITEWQVEWLDRGARKADDIRDFLQKHTNSN